MKNLPVGRLAAEFVVIVVGVLVALAADAWIEGRSQHRLEVEHLQDLRADASVAIGLIDEAIAEEAERLRLIRELRLQGRASTPPSDSIDIWITTAMWGYPLHQIPFDAYAEMASAGRLDLITSSDVRRSLTEVQRLLTNFHRMQEDAGVAQLTYVDPLMVRDFDLTRIISPIRAEGWTPSEDHPGLLRRPEVQNILAAKTGFSTGSRDRLEGLRSAFESLVDLLDAELVQ